MIKLTISVLTILSLTLFSCLKHKNNPIPSIPFDITINLDLPSYNTLQGIGGWAYIQGGVQGIVVYRKSTNEFIAFDRQSPVSVSACGQALTVNKDNFLQLDDSCTNAKFSLFDGSAISGSEIGLRQYQTFWNNSNLLRIYN